MPFELPSASGKAASTGNYYKRPSPTSKSTIVGTVSARPCIDFPLGAKNAPTGKQAPPAGQETRVSAAAFASFRSKRETVFPWTLREPRSMRSQCGPVLIPELRTVLELRGAPATECLRPHPRPAPAQNVRASSAVQGSRAAHELSVESSCAASRGRASGFFSKRASTSASSSASSGAPSRSLGF